MVKIVIDAAIPYLKGIPDQLADVTYLHHEEITARAVHDADALVVRTRTKCNAGLLSGSRVRLIASATIGYDHIDTKWCAENGVVWRTAPGCNATAVVQYVLSALSHLSLRDGWSFSDRVLGIVGVGAVGTQLARWAKAAGMRVLLCDPPRAYRERSADYVTLPEICRRADIISLHPGLTFEGKYKTYNLADAWFFLTLRRRPALINAARGEVIDTEMLLKAIDLRLVSDTIIDCWNDEPHIDRRLLHSATLATPHIAGYSVEGKLRASYQCVKALNEFFGLEIPFRYPESLPAPEKIITGMTPDVRKFFLDSFDIEAESKRLKSAPEQFERLRSSYPLRREWSAFVDEDTLLRTLYTKK